jgi:putative endonuclease
VFQNSVFLGKSGEDIAVRFLKEQGYNIIVRNFRTKCAEIDIIAQDKGFLCFIEVKSRSDEKFGAPQEAVIARKQRHLASAALYYLKINNCLNRKSRFDVVTVIFSGAHPQTRLIKNAFSFEDEDALRYV